MEKKRESSSKFYKDFSTKITLEGETYNIESEDLGIKNPTIITRTYHKGKVISSNKISYKDILNKPTFDKQLKELVREQQNIAIKALKQEKLVPKRTYKGYLEEIITLITRNSYREALELSNEAIKYHTHNPIILSYLGFLEVVVNKRYDEGIIICKNSFNKLKEQQTFGEGFFSAVLYLNLGRAYLAANKKKEAHIAFKRGLKIDKKNEDILSELKKLGIRRKPPLPFLKRSNPLNKYIGKLTSK